MSHGRQFTLYSHAKGFHGWKVASVLGELGLTYKTVYFDFAKREQKSPEHVKLNPNGRIPTLVDHQNDDFVIWESGAIVVYLTEKPYFGQAVWFIKSHNEKIPSAIERYQKEIIRVFGVLKAVLSKQEWLVADKCTVADLSFVMWNNLGLSVLQGYENFDFQKDFPAVAAWHAKLNTQESIKKTVDLRASMLQNR